MDIINRAITISTAKEAEIPRMDIIIKHKEQEQIEINKTNSSNCNNNQFNFQKASFLKTLEARFKMARPP